MAIISSNECVCEAHGEPVSSMLITLCEEVLTCPMSCRHAQLLDTLVSRLMTDRLILKSFDVAAGNIVEKCITVLVL